MIDKRAPGEKYTAKAAKINTNEYLPRMMDTKGIYYESGVIKLSENYTAVILKEKLE